jgi:hypothetical protein
MDVPPFELAAVLDSVRDGHFDEEEWFREVLKFYRLRRLTTKASEQLKAAVALVGD